ncbi:N-acetylmuramoyl-L-alanine amidase [Methyloceanibacter superfactus]|uniref:N-acetylmuramoyl-L-alanine amidase n=1 Tax=Methyloceanibacter superfactus TaxID=1774969 RepID=UPI001FCDE88B|nr:N-acetylmuramoyl-L-alanine amidase [Methyloceanibacter superfactus]
MRAVIAGIPIWAAALGLLAVPGVVQAKDTAKEAVAKDARLAGDRERTRFIADLSKKVDVHVFALGNPYRVIVDAADVSFQMPPGLGKEQRGLVTAYRYGLFAPGKSRIVIDVSGPFLIDKSFVLEARDDQPARLVIDLVPTDEATFQTKLREVKQASAASTPVPFPEPPTRPADAKPIIVLDPGHGGVDPGTSSESGVTEKEVVLQFAKELRQKLVATGRYEVHLTREDDTFLPLKERVAIAQKKGAGLFLSIHADYFPARIDDARGATIYTLSERASERRRGRSPPRRTSPTPSPASSCRAIPTNWWPTSSSIWRSARHRTGRWYSPGRSSASLPPKNKSALHTKRLRSAGFRVLKAPDVPSVLLELGFLSNPDDEKLLTSAAWRDRMGDSVTAAVDGYFTKRIARSPY